MGNKNMNKQVIKYAIDDQEFDIFVVSPEGPGPFPAVLIIHAYSGRDELMEQKAQQIAKLGYIGAAIDLYGVGIRGKDRSSSQKLMANLLQNPLKLQQRLRQSLKHVKNLSKVDSQNIAAIGFCFGGMCSILMSRMGLDLKGVVSFHGLLKVGTRFENDASAKILVLHGQDDPMVTPTDIGEFALEMKRINAEWQLHAYPKTVHAFTNPRANDPEFGTVYNRSADMRSWMEMERFFSDLFAMNK